MFKSLVLPVLRDKRSWKYLSLTLALALTFIGVGVWYTKWIAQWMNAFESKDFLAFKWALAQFILLAAAWVVTYGYRSFFRKKLSFVFREKITEILIQHHAANGITVGNWDQRISEDTIRFSELFTSLALQGLSSMISLPLYLYLLFTSTPWYVSVMGIVYAGVTTLGAKKIAGPLQVLDYEQQTREANYRYKMVQIRDGKSTELPSLDEIKINWVALASRAKILSFFQSGQNLASTILPLIVLAPAYFLTGSMTLGMLWATRNIWGEVLDALSFFVNSYDSIAELKANSQRMTELLKSEKVLDNTENLS